jgi:alpha-acetolactate decarboxylase
VNRERKDDVKGVNVPGYHTHFLAADLKAVEKQ